MIGNGSNDDGDKMYLMTNTGYRFYGVAEHQNSRGICLLAQAFHTINLLYLETR
jgi:hypothetical protein